MDAFALAYTGPDVDEGEIDLGTLAPAMLALGGLLGAMSREFNGPDVKVSTRVQAFSRGSFEVQFALGLSMLPSLLGKLPRFSAAEIMGLVTGASKGALSLWDLVARLRGALTRDATTPAPVVTPAGDGNVVIQVHGDNNAIIVPGSQYQAVMLTDVRTFLGQLVAPVTSDGINGMELLRPGAGAPLVRVEREVAMAAVAVADARPPAEDLGDETSCQWLTVARPAFEERLKWSLRTASDQLLNLAVPERFYREHVASGEPFAIGDILHVRIATHTSARGSKLEARQTIIEVLEHRRRGVQGALSWPEPTP